MRGYETRLIAPALSSDPEGGLRRREFFRLLGGAAVAPLVWPHAARAQQPGKSPTIRFLGATTPTIWSAFVGAFLQRLRELGWIDGRNITIEYRWAEGRDDRYAAFAAEFVRRKVDVIVTAGTTATMAVKKATSTIPIVFASAGDPVRTGLVASLAHPGQGNVTGLSNLQTDLGGLRLELLREVVPALNRVAVLGNVDSPLITLEIEGVEAAAATLGLHAFEARSQEGRGYHPKHRSGQRRCRCAVCLQRSLRHHASGSHQHVGGQRQVANNSCISRARCSWGPDVLRAELPGSVPTVRRFRREDSSRLEARRYPGRAADQVRSRHQYHDREGARRDYPQIVFDCAPTK